MVGFAIPVVEENYYFDKALVSGHPRGSKKVSVTRAGRLRECENTEFVWEFN